MWVRESAGNQQQQWWVKSEARGKAKQGSGWIILLCHNLSFLDCYQKVPPTPGKDLPPSIKATRTVLQLKLLMQEILICSELALKQTIITSTLIKFRIKCLPAYLYRKWKADVLFAANSSGGSGCFLPYSNCMFFTLCILLRTSSVAIVLGVEAWRASLMLHSAKEVLSSSVIGACAMEV